MTEPTDIDALIAEARTLARHSSLSQMEHATSISDLSDALESTLAELRQEREVIEKELARHTEKHGETPRYAPDDYQAEREPTHWEPYVICNACGTDYPCRTRQTLSTYDRKEQS